MVSPGVLIRRERERLGLSTRDLATVAKVSYPTISRIEHEHEQPRWDTLQRIARALGKTFNLGLDDAHITQIADLSDFGVQDLVGDVQPDWTRLRGFVDRLRLHPELTAVAIVAAPPMSGSSLLDNLLAAIAEKLADDIGIRRPSWTKQVPPLGTRWEAPGTPRMRAARAASTPEQFAARNVTLPQSAIWRDHLTVPA